MSTVTESPPELSRPADHRAELWKLVSPAECELLPHLARGLSNKEIASVLGKAPATVKAQVASALKKLELPSRGRLAAWLHANKPKLVS